MSRSKSVCRRLGVAVLASAVFAIGACSDSTGVQFGDVQVTVVTSGGGDPDGYSILLDGGTGQAIDANGSVRFERVQVGDHAVQLTGEAAICAVAGQNPRTVAVSGGSTAETTFQVTCEEPPATGSVEVSVTVSGESIDDAYTVSVDGGAGQAIAAGEMLVIDELSEGEHELSLGGSAANCTVGGANPRTVTVASADTVAAAFQVMCSVPPEDVGALTVTTTTTGASVDDDGFTIILDGGAPVATGVNDTLTTTGLAVGDHVVELSGVAGNCAVGGNNPRTVAVAANDTTLTAFDITCAAVPEPSGAIRAITETTGSDLDPDGYSVTVVDSARTRTIGVSDTVVIEGFTPGDHTVQIDPGSIAGNCMLVTSNPIVVAVADGDTVDAVFELSCADTGGGVLVDQIVFHSERDGNLEIYVMDPSGAGQTNLTNDPAKDELPAISPDGTKIAFVSDRAGGDDIWVMDANGGDPVRLTSSGADEGWPAWSPDGGTIVFSREGGTGLDLFTISSDGTGSAAQLTSAAGDEKQADWCPAPAVCGDTIVYTGADPEDGPWPDDLFKVSASGGAAINLTNGTPHDTLRDGRADWSPDGTRIAWDTNRDLVDCPPAVTECHAQIYLMNSDGTGKTRVTELDGATDYAPAWSPDGSEIVFGSKDRGGQAGGDIFILDPAGTETAGTANIARVTTDPALDVQPDWGS